MPNWTESMIQSYAFYEVDPATWADKKLIDTISSCSINRDLDSDTLGSASMNMDGFDHEMYVRVYMIVNQNGITDREPLGTFLLQSPSYSYNGYKKDASINCYTPLIELSEKKVPIGFYAPKDSMITNLASEIIASNVRAPVVSSYGTERLFSDFVSKEDESWLSFVTALLATENKILYLEPDGKILIGNKPDKITMQPIYRFDTGNSSILYPDITIDMDIYNIPNVVEVIYSNDKNQTYARVSNDDPSSPVSTYNRGREIVNRIVNPDIVGNVTESQLEEYANNKLKELSTLEYKITYTHAYCPVRIGDCVQIDYPDAGLENVKALVTSQRISCEPGCPVEETAIIIKELWSL